MNDITSPGVGHSPEIVNSRRYLWVMLSLVTGTTFASGLVRMGLPVLYPFIQTDFGLSRAQVGLITSFLAAGNLVTVALAGWLTDKFGVKRMIIVGMVGMMVPVFFPLAYNFPLVLGLVVLIGIVSSSVNPALTRAVIDWFPLRIRALVMSFKQMGVPAAGAITAALLPVLCIAMGWRMTAVLTSAVILLITVVFVLLYRDAPQNVPQSATGFNLAMLKTIARNRGLVMTTIWGAFFVGFQSVALSYLMLFLIENLGLSTIMAGGMLAVAQVSSIIARVFWGAASDFIFHGRRVVVMAITGFLTALWMLGASLVGTGTSDIAIYIMAVIIGISTFSFQGVFLTLVGEQAEPGQVGLTIGVSSAAIQASQMLMPPLFGYLADVTNSYGLSWRVTAVLALISTVALVVFGREGLRR